MKTFVLFICVMFLSSLSAQVVTKKLYPFKTAEIEYAYEGNSTGKQILYIDNYGFLQCNIVQTVSTTLGKKIEKNETRVTKELDIYWWDIKTRQGRKIHNALTEQMMNDPTIKTEEFGKFSMETMGFEKKGTETISGKLCEIWSGLGGSTKIWLWKGLTLKSEINMFGTKTIFTATNIKIDGVVPADKFAIPSDIKFEVVESGDATEILNKMKGKGRNGADSTKKDTPVGDAQKKKLNDLKDLLKKMKTE